MILYLILAISLAAFLIKFFLLFSSRNFQNRRGLTGGEIARQILDLNGLMQTTVAPLQGPIQNSEFNLKQLYLAREIYEGKSLLDIALAARAAMMKSKMPSSGFSATFEGRSRLWKICGIGVGIGWASLLLGLGFHIHFFHMAGLTLFIVVCVLAFLDLPVELEVNEMVCAFLKQSRHFEVDELARFKNLLRSFQFDGASQIFNCLFGCLKGWRHGA